MKRPKIMFRPEILHVSIFLAPFLFVENKNQRKEVLPYAISKNSISRNNQIQKVQLYEQWTFH